MSVLPLTDGIIDGVKPLETAAQITSLREELNKYLVSVDDEQFISWQLRTRSVLAHALGEGHHITRAFIELSWITMEYGNPDADRRAFSEGETRATGILDAAAAEIGLLAAEVPVADESGIDYELWEHVAPEVRAEAWGKVARGAVVFTEDRIRKWAGRPAAEVSKDLAIAVFGQSGDYRMGKLDGEKQGWQLFAQGIAQALRNVETHRIQDRPDHKRYAMGVLGACSLLLTQMRYEHGNRFQDTSPASPDLNDVGR